METAVQVGGVLAFVPRQIGTAHGTHEQRVSGTDKPGRGPAAEIAHHEADALGRVPGRVKHTDHRIAELDHLLVDDGLKRERDVGRGMEAIASTRARRESETARGMIRVNVRVEHVAEPQSFGGGERDVRIHVARVRIDNAAEAMTTAPEHIRRTPGVEAIERAKDHGTTAAPVVIGNPAARHSTTPSSDREAESPCFRSATTACSAYTQ